MLILIVLSFSLYVLGKTDFKRHVQNSATPFNTDPPEYNIETWVNRLNLQHCVIVEIGDDFCALFVEFHEVDDGSVQEYFLGICNIEVLLQWRYCSSILELQRPEKCTLDIKDMYRTRVHRRLCDFSILTPFAQQCNCSLSNIGKTLYKVTGFPTCFISPLPDILCSSYNVCGLASCSTETVAYQIVKFKCSGTCAGHDKFCQYPITNTTLAADISSFWSDWSEPSCVDLPCKTVISEARCINRNTGNGAIDCLGPGTSCCPAELNNCKCHLYLEGPIMKVVRIYTTNVHYWQHNEAADYLGELDFLLKPDYENENYYKIDWKRKVELSADPYFATIYASKNRNRMKVARLKQRDTKEEELDDDDEPEDNEDNNEEDIIVEEDRNMVETTMPTLERDDIAQRQAESMKKNILNENDEVKNTSKTSASSNPSTSMFLSVLFPLHSFILIIKFY